jgi:hypothetical protein
MKTISDALGAGSSYPSMFLDEAVVSPAQEQVAGIVREMQSRAGN